METLSMVGNIKSPWPELGQNSATHGNAMAIWQIFAILKAWPRPAAWE